jgi:hypothetical protein
VQGIDVALLEVLVTPIPPETVCKYILDLALFRGNRHVGVPALTIHAIGLLISALPIDEFLQPIWQELMNLITGDQYLTEISEPCRLVSTIKTGIHFGLHDYANRFLIDSMWYSSKFGWRTSESTTATERCNQHCDSQKLYQCSLIQSYGVPIYL